MRAVPFGEDGCTGDSAFYPSEEDSFPVSGRSEFDELLELWVSARQAQDDLEDEDERPVGFWLLEDRDWGTVQLVDTECYNDSQVYTLNRARKTLCNSLAAKIVGDASALEDD